VLKQTKTAEATAFCPITPGSLVTSLTDREMITDTFSNFVPFQKMNFCSWKDAKYKKRPSPILHYFK